MRKTFRKIVDYLFRGRVPLSSIEDAWKVKVADRKFKLKELEDLCTKFLQYRIDARNLIHFLKNPIQTMCFPPPKSKTVKSPVKSAPAKAPTAKKNKK